MKNDVRIGADDIVIFLDEVGDQTFSDPENKHFGFGGVVIRGGDQYSYLYEKWTGVRQSLSSGVDAQLHAKQINWKSKYKTRILESFFAENFDRFFVGVKQGLNLPAEGSVLEYLLIGIFEHQLFGDFLPDHGDVHVIFEHSSRDFENISRIMIGRVRKNIGIGERFKVWFKGKSSDAPLLEVADFVSNAGGDQMKEWKFKGAIGRKRKFMIVFNEKWMPNFRVLHTSVI